MALRAEDWTPTSEDLTYWRFLRLSGRPIVAWLCLNEGKASMWARPRDPLMRSAFWNKHAGHEHVFVGEVLDQHLKDES
ncbi:MAG TPA: hypothetical protein VKU60_01630 [Chloroflexota bacterium]|nr:hypothetical protein [Chloroflexota bacterium]